MMISVGEFNFIVPKVNREKSTKIKDKVRIFLYKNKRIVSGCQCFIYIGKDVAQKIDLAAGDKIQIGINKENLRKVMLKKSKIGFTASAITKSANCSCLKLGFAGWEIFQIKPEDFPSGEVKYTIDEDNNILFEI